MGVAVFIVVCIVRLMSRDLHQFQGGRGDKKARKNKEKPWQIQFAHAAAAVAGKNSRQRK